MNFSQILFIIFVIVCVALLVTTFVVLATTLTGKTENGTETITLTSLENIYVSEPYYPSGKTVFSLTAVHEDIIQEAFIVIYFNDGVINPSLGNSSFNGKLFNIAAFSIPNNTVNFLIKFSSNLKGSEVITITLDKQHLIQ